MALCNKFDIQFIYEQFMGKNKFKKSIIWRNVFGLIGSTILLGLFLLLLIGSIMTFIFVKPDLKIKNEYELNNLQYSSKFLEVDIIKDNVDYVIQGENGPIKSVLQNISSKYYIVEDDNSKPSLIQYEYYVKEKCWYYKWFFFNSIVIGEHVTTVFTVPKGTVVYNIPNIE